MSRNRKSAKQAGQLFEAYVAFFLADAFEMQQWIDREGAA